MKRSVHRHITPMLMIEKTPLFNGIQRPIGVITECAL